MTREDAIAILKHKVLACLRGTKWGEALEMAIKALEQEPTTKIEESNFSQDQYLADIQSAYDCGYEQAKNNLAVDCISRADALDCVNWGYSFSDIYKKINELPSIISQEPQTFKWCTDCKEYDQEKHCCHRWSKVIRDTVEEMKQEYIEREVLDKIRAEIENINLNEVATEYEDRFYGFQREVLKILDKYKAESEG